MRRTVVVILVATLLAAAWLAWAQPGQARAGQEAQVDFNGDNFTDLAVGAPVEKVGTLQSAGAVTVFYASGGGVLSAGEAFTQDSPGLGGTAEAFDFFGAALE